MVNGMTVAFTKCYKDKRYFDEHTKMCTTVNVGTSKLTTILLVFTFTFALLIWVDYAYAINVFNFDKLHTKKRVQLNNYASSSINSHDNYRSLSQKKEKRSFFHVVRVPLAFFVVISSIIYLLYFFIIPFMPQIYTIYDRIVIYSYLTFLAVIAVMIIIYGIRLAYVSHSHLSSELRKKSRFFTLLTCFTGALILAYVLFTEIEGTRVRLEYRLNNSLVMFFEQFIEVCSLGVMAYMLRSTGKRVPKWKRDMTKGMKDSLTYSGYSSSDSGE